MKNDEKAKSDLIQKLVETRTRIITTAEGLVPVQQREVFLGVWSARELLAHLAGWDLTNLEAAEAVLNGKLPDFYAHSGKDWQTYNALLVEKYGREDFGEQIALARETHTRLVDFLRTLPTADLWQDRGVRARGWIVTIGRLLEAELGDEETHLNQILEFADRVSESS